MENNAQGYRKYMSYVKEKILNNMYICQISVIYYRIIDVNSQRFYFTVICKNYQ